MTRERQCPRCGASFDVRDRGCGKCTLPNVEVVAELAHVTALFQARTIATVIGAPMPVPERFRR